MSQMKKMCTQCCAFRPILGGKIKYKEFTCKRCLDTCTHSTKRYDKHLGYFACLECGEEL